MNNQGDLSIQVGKILATNAPGKEIVITGIAGRFPECDNVEQFREKLKNNVCMVTNDDRRWKRTYEETPYSMGKVNSLDKFDADFFDVSYHQANQMDPQCRKLMEVAVEAVLDSGYNLTELQQTKTAVIVAATTSDSEKILFFDKQESPHFGFDGCSHSMLAHQISYHLGLNGPSTNVDTACASALYGVEKAYRSIKMGYYDNAIIAGAHTVLNPILNQFFYKLGLVSLEGDTLVFDGNGYIRSEAVVAIFLQRAVDARRVYAEVVHIKVSVDGFKNEGITFPSEQMISRLFEETFAECNLNPNCLVALEAHATGTKIGDPQELNAIYKTMGKHHKSPFLVGSVKSSIGHTEPAASLCSVIKMILGMNNDVIYPNCNNYDIRELQEAMLKKNLKIITETMDWPKNSTEMVGFNGFGFGGANGFLILKRHLKEKKLGGSPEDDLPRLVCFSAQNEQCLQPILDDLASRRLDVEYVRLWHAIHRYGVKNHKARGFVILSKTGIVTKSSGRFDTTPLCLFFDGLNANWRVVLQELSAVDLFQKNADRVLKVLGVKCVESNLVGNVVTYVALVDTLRDVGVAYEFVLGRSLGVLFAAYADGALSLPELVLCAQRIDSFFNNNLVNNKLGFAMQQKLVDDLKIIIPRPKLLSNKCILLNKNGGLSAEYIVNCLFAGDTTEALNKTLGQTAIVAFGAKDCGINASTFINMLSDDVINCFLTGLGRIYQLGHNLELNKLYPHVPFPVSRGTPIISPLIQWAHDQDWFLYRPNVIPSNSVQTFDFFLKGQDPDWIFLTGHVLGGRCITPMSAFIYMVWDTFSKMMGVMKVKMSVTFENVRMHKIIDILQENEEKLVVRILKHSQRFEINQRDEVIFSGTIAFGDGNLTAFSQKQVKPAWVLTEDEVYKQLQLRGYHYINLFRCVKDYDSINQQGLVSWNNNWTAFIDGLMQLNLLHKGGKLLELPVKIGKLQINAESFLKSKTDLKRVFLQNNCVGCDEIVATNIATKVLKRQNDSSRTVLQYCKFVPYSAQLSLYEALQVNLQIVLENISSKILKMVEVANERVLSLTPMAKEALQNFPLVQTETSVLPEDSKAPLLTKESAHLLIIRNALKQNILDAAFKAVNKQGFVLSREDSKQSCQRRLDYFDIVSNYDCGEEHLVLLKRSVDYTPSKVIHVKSDDFTWIHDVQHSLKLNESVLLIAKDDPTSGVLGFVNCLKLEHKLFDFKYIFWQENGKGFDLDDRQLKKNLFANVFKDGVWGSYKNLALDAQEPDVSLGKDHQLFAVNSSEKPEVLAHYASVLVGNKSLPDDNLVKAVEFSGTEKSGKRVMGFGQMELVSRAVQPDPLLLWTVPDNWSLAEAATVPQAYASALYLLFVAANLHPGDNILLHSLPATTATAIVNIAERHNCHVFITDQNRQPLTNKVHVGRLNTLSFRKKISAQIVINASKTKDLHLLTNCLAPGGVFLQITTPKSPPTLEMFNKFKYTVVDLTSALDYAPIKQKLHLLVEKNLSTKTIEPIPAEVIKDEVMSQPEKVLVNKDQFLCTPKFCCNSEDVYVVVGGLGGVGLELIEWLIERGARKLTVCSRSKHLTAYQKMKLHSWKPHGVDVSISNNDVTTEEGTTELLQFAKSFGNITAVFNLAAVTKDDVFENYTLETFSIPFPTKAFAVKHLDKVSRNLCPNLKYFVVFSSFGSSFGNTGQTNYNMANSVMERVCEKRKVDGYPALAIQWGPLADVGLVTRIKNYNASKTFNGAMQQNLQSAFEIIERFLTQNKTVVLCIILPDSTTSTTSDSEHNIKNIIGITNLNAISYYVPLPELGMDSITSVEVQSYLKENYGVFLDIAEVNNLTFARLKNLITPTG